MLVATIGDLPVELIEKIAQHLDVKDVLELMMVNKRMMAIYARDQSIVFGTHVAGVMLGGGLYSIKKIVDSPYLKLNETLLPFAKRIDAADKLDLWGHIDGVFLNQLKYVNQLGFYVDTEEHYLEFLTNFRGSVEKNAKLTIRFGLSPPELEEALKEQLGKFIENQLNGCEEVSLKCDSFHDLSHVYLEAMMKTRIKMISIESTPPQTFSVFTEIARWIVNHGIPSKNSEAVIHIVMQTFCINPPQSSDFLSHGLQRVDNGEDHSALVSHANTLIKANIEGHPFSEFPSYSNFPKFFTSGSTCFRQQIDPTTSCIYMFELFVRAQFLGFYTSSL